MQPYEEQTRPKTLSEFVESKNSRSEAWSWNTERTSSNAVISKTRPCKVRRMYFAAFATLLMGNAMGLAIGYSGPALYDMATRPDSAIKPSEDEATWIGSILTLGIMLGSMYAGLVADRFGRKEVLIFNIIPLIAGWLIIGCAKSVVMVVIGRLVCGLGLGLVNVIVPVYCVEISTSDVRGLLGSAFQAFLCIGNLLSAVIGSLVSWEYLALAGALFSAVSLLCCLPIPESPRWLASKGQIKRAILAMDFLQGGYVDADEECKAILEDMENKPKGRLSFKEFLHPTVYKPVFIVACLTMFQQLSGAAAVFYYSTTIFNFSKTVLSPKQCTIILSSVMVVTALFSNCIVDRAGRKLLLLISTSFTAITLAGFGTIYYISLTHKDILIRYNWLPLLILNLFVIGTSVGIGTVPCLSAAELVPIRARSTASGISIFTANLFAFIVTKSFSESNKHIGIHGTFWSYGCCCVIAFFFVLFMVPETKGKNLEDISKIFDYPENRDSILLVS